MSALVCSRDRSTVRPGLTTVLAALMAIGGLIGPAARPASAHGGGQQAEPIMERMTPTVPGIQVDVAFSVNYQFVAGNSSGQPITFLADTGEGFLRIGPDGVYGNFASPTFYDSNSPEGASRFPDRAKPGPDVSPIWRRIGAEPSWGWYDHRLHPADRAVPPEVIRAKKVAVLGRWKVPVRIGDQPGEIEGRFEYRPPTGSYTMVQKSSPTPAEGVRIHVVPGSVVPAVFVENRSSDPVVVLGRAGEPFARIGPTITEVNVKSPTWVEAAQARGQDPSDEADANADPKWQRVADGSSWTWLEFRAAAPKQELPEALINRGRVVTVRNWSIPYLIGDRRGAIEGATEFVPIAELRKGAAGESDGDSHLPAYAGLGVGGIVVVASVWLIALKRHRRWAVKG